MINGQQKAPPARGGAFGHNRRVLEWAPIPALLLGWTAGGGAGALDHVARIDDRRGPPLAGLEADDDVLVELGLAPRRRLRDRNVYSIITYYAFDCGEPRGNASRSNFLASPRPPSEGRLSCRRTLMRRPRSLSGSRSPRGSCRAGVGRAGAIRGRSPLVRTPVTYEAAGPSLDVLLQGGSVLHGLCCQAVDMAGDFASTHRAGERQSGFCSTGRHRDKWVALDFVGGWARD